MSNLFSSLIIGGLKKIKSFLFSPFRKLGIGFFYEKYLKHTAIYRFRYVSIYGHKIKIYDTKELFQSLNEIFIERFYDFPASNNAPYILDCGSNIGLSILFYKLSYPNARVIGFEPDESNFNLLSENIKAFGYSDIYVHKAAIWKENGIVRFSNGGTTSSRIDAGSADSSDVSCIRLRDYLSSNIDFLKLDIEGAEYEVFQDCKDLLSNVKNIFIEYHGIYGEEYKFISIISILAEAGFKFYIKESANIYRSPFLNSDRIGEYDLQLNIFAFR